MRIRVGAEYIAVGVQSYDITWDSGIDWRSVGRFLRPLDRGADTAKWSTAITIKAAGDTLRQARKLLMDAANQGTTVNLLCADWECVFGPEMDYSTELAVVLPADEAAYSNPDTAEATFTEWTFSAFPVEDLAARMGTASQLPARDMWIQSITRSRGGQRGINELEESRAGYGFGVELETVTIGYRCKRAKAEQAKAWLLRRRSAPMWLENTALWLFNEDRTDSESVYILDVKDEGALDTAAREHAFSVTYGRADMVGYPSLVSMETTVSGAVGSTVQLHPVFSDGEDHSEYCAYSTSNAAGATVSDTGLVTFVSDTAATISAVYRGVTKTCAANGVAVDLLYLDEADIAMLTTDASSGASTFQLNPVFSDSGSHASSCTWASNSASFTVSNSGLVTCLVSGSPITATISCTLNSVTKTVSVTGYATLPDSDTRYTLKGGAASAAGFIQASAPLLSLPYFYIDQKLMVDEVEVGSLACRGSASQTHVIIHGFYSGDYRVIIREQKDTEYIDRYYDYAIPAGLTRLVVGQATDGVYIAGSARGVMISPTTATPGTHPNNFVLSWGDAGDVRKIVTASGDGSANYSQLQAKANCDLYYIPQNYIRYTDTLSRTNYTIIPNMGTLGATYNLTANNVPSGWFGV